MKTAQKPDVIVAHTPGPWRAHVGRITVDIADMRGNRVGDTSSVNDDLSISETEIANGKLMAAAPELLDTCRKLLAAAKCGYDPEVTLSEYGAMAEAAIAKATA